MFLFIGYYINYKWNWHNNNGQLDRISK
jgi:hypothetical protein